MLTFQKKQSFILSIIKNNLFLNGLFVSDELYEYINKSIYYGYQTTSGIFLKLGGTLSKQDFDKLKNSKFSKISFEDYLKIREYTTINIKKASSMNKNDLKNSTFFILKKDKKGKLYIIGQYATKQKIFKIKITDCGFFKQTDYKDEPVVLQAGGARIRNSICGQNCISGCKFCDFSKSSEKYIDNYLNNDRKKYIIDLIKLYSFHNNVQTLCISGGNPCLTDMHKWTEFLKDSINTFKYYIPNGFIDVILSPRGFDKYVYDKHIRYNEYKKYLEYLKSIGVTSISPNIELWTQDGLDKFCPISNNKSLIGVTKSEIGHDGYIDFIKAGVEVFGKYNVRTSLIVGLNSIKNIKNAIDYLLPLGCHIVISPLKSSDELKYLEPTDYDLIELSHYMKTKLSKLLNSFPKELANIYNERIVYSLNAHNSHNTANLCCNQNLDFLEQQILVLGKDPNIVTNLVFS